MVGAESLDLELMGRYEVVARIAKGGMAELLLGRLTGPGGFERAVAIKRILPSFAEQSDFVDMFMDEARIAATVQHPNVVQHYELGSDDGELMLVMEYLQGESLASMMRRARAMRRAIPVELAVHIIAEACAGLHAAHESTDLAGSPRELVHRDVSPNNIFITYSGGVKILDFGIAKAAGRITRTEAGMLKGKYAYMSPEQSRGEPLDRRSDIFAAGIVLYELTTGHRLFHRPTSLASLRAVQEDEIIPPRRVITDYPATLERVVLDALHRTASKRTPRADALRHQLLKVQQALPTTVVDFPAALARMMEDLFPERIVEQREILARLRAGDEISRMPSVAVDVEVELPDVTAITRVPGGGRWQRVVLALLAITAIAGGLWFGLRFDGSEETEVVEMNERATTRAPAERASTMDGAGSTAPSDVDSLPTELSPHSVTIQVISQPRADLFLDDVAYGRTPADVELETSDELVELRLERQGYRREVDQIRPDVAQRREYRLRRVRRGTRPAMEVAPVELAPMEPSKMERRFPRFE